MEPDLRLAAILYADIAEFSRHMETDEEGTLQAVRETMASFADTIKDHRGVKIKEVGDAILGEFQIASAAVKAALSFQKSMGERDPGDDPIEYRIGVNLGEIFHQDGDVFGDGVNIAARIQEICEPGGVAISASVSEQVKGKLEYEFSDTGFHRLKNISRPVQVFALGKMALSSTVHPAAFLNASRVKNQPLFDLDGSEIVSRHLATGGCLCGRVRFEVSEPEIGTGYCHCRICRKAVGAVVNTWVAFPLAAVRFIGQPPRYYRSSPIAERGFCPDCGTSLTYHLDRPDASEFMVICVAAMDEPEKYPPVWHGGIESRIPWFNIHDDLPRMDSRESPALKKAWSSVGRDDPEKWKPLEDSDT